MKTGVFLLTVLFFTLLACGPMKRVADDPARADAPVIIYKMKADYSNQVPVTLDEGKKQIVSYPHPSDLYTVGVLALPTKLIRGYWLDIRGINLNSVFLKYTYKEYASRESSPSVVNLMESILDSDPFIEIYECGKRNEYKNLIKELNKKIRANFEGCRRLK